MSKYTGYDFCGWATKNNIRCSDGRTIRRDAFKDCDGQQVPLVWMHKHDSASNVLGHAMLENRPDGVYAYGYFNENESGREARELVKNRDVVSLSIFANQLKQDSLKNVLHGAIREVSLVLAGANPGAMIENVLVHGEGEDDTAATIYTGEYLDMYDRDEYMEHADKDDASENSKKSEKTIKEVFDTLNEEQKQAVYAVIGLAVESAKIGEDTDDEDEEDEEMKHNLFDMDDAMYYDDSNTLSHDEMNTIISDGKRFGSLKDSFLAHADEYGIQNIDWLFPEYQNVDGDGAPSFINIQPQEWVGVVMSNVHHTPFSRIKSMYADIREDEARAKGYIKGNMKKEEVFTLLKRTTDPQTVYKKQKLDRDDVIDITDFDVVSWIKGEMRMKLDEELARAILVGDGRLADDDDKIQETHIRPVISDADLYTIKKTVIPASDEEAAHAVINAAIRARKDYQGSGNPLFFTSEDLLADMLLLEDQIGHRLYKTEAELATALRVSRIVPFPYMPDDVYAFEVNLSDYNIGADKGGSINMFDDFDIDYNQQKYLIETRCSGALIKPYSAIVLKKNQ